MARTRPVIGTTTRQSIAAQPGVARTRRRPIKQRLLLVLIAIAIVLLALGGLGRPGAPARAVMAWPQ
jgi:hypothetical protein